MNFNSSKVFSNLLFILFFLIIAFPCRFSFAQKQGARVKIEDRPTIRVSPFATQIYSAPGRPELSPNALSSQVRDTLRNFVKGNTVFRIPASTVFADAEGWIHGTNSFEDISKATRISLPDGVSSATLSEVHVTFIHKANQVTNEIYSIDVYDVGADGGPGNLLATQVYSYEGVNADEDLNTSAFTTWHLLDTPITVPGEFFVSVDLGAYGAGQYSNIAIASTDFLGRYVDEDWEQLSDGTWANMSESWISTANDGWYSWLEAVVDYQDNTGTAPTISHTPITTAQAVNDLVITANLSSPNGISSASILYLEGGSANDATKTTVMTSTGGGSWQGTIAASSVDTRGLLYQITTSDVNGNQAATNIYNVSVSTDGITRNLGVQGATASDYRLFSIPINLDNTNAAAVLEDDLGTYDPNEWRMFGLNANQSYSEFPGAGALQAGRAFWIAMRQANSITTGSGSTTSLADVFSISLNPGWTFVGIPFDFAVPQDRLQLASGNALDIRAFNGSWGTLGGALQPFAGYAVAATSSDQLQINVFPLAAKTAPQHVKNIASTYTWSIGIHAASDHAVDDDNVLAVAPNASTEWDQLDRPEPPVIGEYISVYFPHEDWNVPFKRFNTDVRPADLPLHQWTFEVASNVTEAFPLTFEGISEVPAELDILLVDNLLYKQQDLRKNPEYLVKASENPHPGRFSLVVGPASEVNQLASELQIIPADVEMESFPNPFQGISTVRFGLSERSNVTISVYDSLGRLTATLLANESREPGYHTASWSGLNDSGISVASGVYFYVLNTGSQTVTKQIVFFK